MRGVIVRTMDQAEVLEERGLTSNMGLKKLDWALIALLVFLLVTATFVFQVWSRLYAFRLGYEIYQQDKIKRELLEENNRLTLEIVGLRSPARLEAIARELGLKSPRPDQLIMVPSHPSQGYAGAEAAKGE